MSTKVDIPQSKPSCGDCLSWSEDGELAIAAGENVVILVPNLRPAHAVANPWIQVRIKVNQFTDGEWPRQPLASFADMSIGEEQSNSHVVSITWSPPGLALHRRSVLAILTANHLLSFWASESDPRDPDSWKRVLVVNNALPYPPGMANGIKRPSKRIRCMAWASIDLNICELNQRLATFWGPFLFAIVGESPEVCIFVASSPYTTGSRDWVIAQCGQFICPSTSQISTPTSLFRQALERSRYDNSTLAFEPVKVHNAEARTAISCRFRNTYTHVAFSTPIQFPYQGSVQAIEKYGVLNTTHSHDYACDFTEQLTEVRRRNAMSNKTTKEMIDIHIHGKAAFGAIRAICFSLHIANQIEYKTTSENLTTVLFQNDKAISEELSFPWEATTVVDVEIAYDRIFNQLESTQLASVVINAMGLKILYSAIILAMLLPEPSRNKRLRQAQGIAAFLGKEIGVPAAFDEEVEVLSYMKIAENAQKLLQQVQAFTVARFPQLLETTSIAQVLDICPIPSCDKAITWERVDESRCLGGHPLGARCSITFLPILKPGQSKKCSNCSRDFINERAHPALCQQHEIQGPPSNSISDSLRPCLANHLLQMFDVCPYCNGKFYTP